MTKVELEARISQKVSQLGQKSYYISTLKKEAKDLYNELRSLQKQHETWVEVSKGVAEVELPAQPQEPASEAQPEAAQQQPAS